MPRCFRPGRWALGAAVLHRSASGEAPRGESLRAQFRRDGFVPCAGVIDAADAEALRLEFDRLFRGDFDTNVYPDEWHWREGISRPDAFREIVNGWKSSDVVARVVMRPGIARLAAEVMGWAAGARLAQDDCLWKPPGAGGVAYHQDAPYISHNFTPREDNSITVWIALDDADEETGVVEYAVGSHAWRCAETPLAAAQFHSADGEAAMRRAAADAGVADVEIQRLRVPCGGAVLHHQDCWHGSRENRSPARPRRALGLHYVRADAALRTEPPPDYIYGRYALGPGDATVHDEFFPVTWSPSGPSDVVKRRLGETGPSPPGEAAPSASALR
ncbi:hypothetical protein M885DRAFT_508521 [Pelagophyceae sp. CCMP2097]|nr:hypothetical protein M885DRAFT_508521 [Pelagophyceae sp. CCMP2097]